MPTACASRSPTCEAKPAEPPECATARVAAALVFLTSVSGSAGGGSSMRPLDERCCCASGEGCGGFERLGCPWLEASAARRPGDGSAFMSSGSPVTECRRASVVTARPSAALMPATASAWSYDMLIFIGGGTEVERAGASAAAPPSLAEPPKKARSSSASASSSSRAPADEGAPLRAAALCGRRGSPAPAPAAPSAPASANCTLDEGASRAVYGRASAAAAAGGGAVAVSATGGLGSKLLTL